MLWWDRGGFVGAKIRYWLGRKKRARDKQLEEENRLHPYRRLIVVTGMARTGTSALTAYLASHPDIKLVVGGPLWHRLESDYFRKDIDWKFLDGVLDEFPTKKILIKQPWLERNTAFFDRAKDAKVIICTSFKNFRKRAKPLS